MKVHELTHEISTTSSIFGRNNEVSVVYEGSHAKTNGNEIILPSMPTGAEISHDDAMVLRGYVDHEAGHIRHTDFKVWNSIKDKPDSPLRMIWNCLEDIRVEANVIDEYQGSQKNLKAVSEKVCERELSYLQKNPDALSQVDANSISTAILKQGRKPYGGENGEKVFDYLPDNVKKWSEKWNESVQKCKSTADTLQLAQKIKELVEEDSELESDPEDFSFEPGEGQEGDQEEEGEGQGEGEGKEQEGEGKGKGKPMESGDEGMSKASDPKEAVEGVGSGIKPDGSKSSRYNVMSTRWDETFTRTSKNKRTDRRHEAMKRATMADYNKITAKIGPVVNVMRTKLRRVLLSKENRDWDFGRQQGRLDTKRLTSAYNGFESVYKMRKDREEFDTAVHLLVDLSGSMGSGRDKSRMEVAGSAAIAFAECLEGSGIKYQVSGFDNGIYGHIKEYYDMRYKVKGSFHRVEPMNNIIYKGFGESLQVARPALSVLPYSTGQNNADRCAVLWAYKELMKQPQKRKVLIVLSDGQPENYMIDGDYQVLYSGLKDAVTDISKKVECVGIGIQTSSVSQFYKNNVTINNLEDLSGTVFNKLSELLLNGKVRL
jgi:cobaltochelatase CobT